MTSRFQIEDLIFQDDRGVFFRATDSGSGKTVALRRFFPSGAQGGGLNRDEQDAYATLLGKLATIHHPAVRAVIAGGCDPVDGIPWVATEWLDGEPLDGRVSQEPLAPQDATILLARALELSLLISEVIGEKAVWVETDLRMILTAADATPDSRGFTFLISPLKRLGIGSREDPGLGAIVQLTEDVLHWRGQLVGAQAAAGLGGWLKWLRGAKETSEIHEALEKLAAATGTIPLPVAPTAARPTTIFKQQVRQGRKTPGSFTTIAVLVALVAVAGIFLKFQSGGSPPTAVAAEIGSPKLEGNSTGGSSTPQPVEATDRVNQRAQELSDISSAQNAAMTARREEIALANGVHRVADRDLLMENAGREVALEGELVNVRLTATGKTLYLEFSENAPAAEARAAIPGDLAQGKTSEAALKGLVGSRIRVRGTVAIEPAGRSKRPVVRFTLPEAIEVVE